MERKPKIGMLVEITREFGRGICRGVSELARETGEFSPFLVNAASLRDPVELRLYDGFIARVMNDRIAKALAATRRPVVDIYYDKPQKDFAIVKTRHATIGQMAADYFLERRFKNFAFCGFAGGRFSKYCRSAFTLALARRGATCDSYAPNARARYDFNPQVMINERLQEAPDAKALGRWLMHLPKPVAVFCPNDLRAWQLLQVCKQLAIDVPHDVAILGLDNDILVCGLDSPMISSIDPNAEEIGRRAAATLLEMMANPALTHRKIVRPVNPLGVVERASTQVYPIEPPWLSEALLFIDQNIAGNLTAADIYRHVKLSHTQVDKVFRAKLGNSVQTEIASTRLERAKHLLSSTRLPIAEIAPKCGFSSAQYLIRTFSKKFGQSPAVWRLAHRPSRQDSRGSARRASDGSKRPIGQG